VPAVIIYRNPENEEVCRGCGTYLFIEDYEAGACPNCSVEVTLEVDPAVFWAAINRFIRSH